MQKLLWVVTLVALLWALRVTGWSLRGALADPDASALSAVLGFSLDLALGLGLIALHRAAAFARAVATGKVRLLLLLGASTLYLALAAVALIRALDLVHCALAESHWTALSFVYLSPANLHLLADGYILPGLVAMLLMGALLFVALLMDARGARARRLAGSRTPRPIAAAAIGAALLTGSLGVGLGTANDTFALHLLPEANFARELLRWYGMLPEERVTAARDALPPDARLRLAALGLAPRSAALPGFPATRRSVDPSPFPYPARVEAAPRTNVVITFVEQLNHEFVSGVSGAFEGVMPELSALAERLSVVEHYYSTTAPTIHTLVSGLCSLYYPARGARINKGGNAQLSATPMSCLPRLLGEAGYRSLFVQGGSKAFSGKGPFLTARGFDEMHGLSELRARFPERDQARWGMYDDTLVDYVQEQILRLEQEATRDGRPYLLTMLTLDTHAPGWPNESCEAPAAALGHSKDVRSQRMLHTLYCVDRALGRLGRFLLDPARADSTLWIILGDHPTARMKFVRAYHRRLGRDYSLKYGRLPLIIHDPRHQLPARIDTLTGTIDLAPTVLHLLGLTETPNAMLGHSAFGRRRSLPALVGRVGPNTCSVRTRQSFRSLPLARLEDMCVRGEPIVEDAEVDTPSACDLASLFGWQDALWEKRRLFPARASRTPAARAMGPTARAQEPEERAPTLAAPSPGLVAHAGGAIDGIRNTNSLDALDASYQAGFELFELDLSWTSDNQLVCLHGWKGAFKNRFGFLPDAIPDLETFSRWVTEHAEHRIPTLDQLMQWLRDHPRARLVTDIKDRNLEGLTLIALRYPELRDRIIPQISTPDSYSAARQLGFKHLIFTTYLFRGGQEEIVSFARSSQLFGVTMTRKWARTSLPAELAEAGVPTFVHTINRREVYLELTQQRQVTSVYTDFLPPRPE